MTEERAHSPVGASQMYRLAACPGSRRLAEQAADPETSIHAARGTAVHEVIEECLEAGHDAADYVGKTFVVDYHSVEITKEDAANAQQMIDLARRLSAMPGAIMYTEERFHLPHIDDEAFGTADVVVWCPEDRILYVLDYKNGSGKYVGAENNFQLAYYATGVVEKLRVLPDVIMCAIVQPHFPGKEEVARWWSLDVFELDAWTEEIRKIIQATKDPEAPLIPGDEQCRWCPAKNICPARTTAMVAPDPKAAFSVVEDGSTATVKLHPVELYTNDELNALLPKLTLLERWIKDAREEAYARAEKRGEDIPGHKLVAKRPRESWVDEEGVISELKSRGYDIKNYVDLKLKTPAQLRKLLGKEDQKWLRHFIEKVSSGTTLVPDDDKREALPPRSANQFTRIEED